MSKSRERHLKGIIHLAVICTLISGGCKRGTEAATTTPSLPAPVPIATPAPSVAPVSAPSTVIEQAPPPPAAITAAPALLPRTIWPSVTLADGRVLERVRVSAEDGATVTLMYAGGVAKVDKRALPAELAVLHPYDPRAAQIAAEQAALRRQSATTANAYTTSPTVTTRKVKPAPAAVPAPQPAVVSADDIEAAVKTRARRYFETEKRLGSGQTLVFGLITDVSEPREVSGWSNRWEVTGTAGYKVYNSIGWGSFSKRSTKFKATIEAPPGQRIVVVSFEERT